MPQSHAYAKLEKAFAQVGVLGEIESVLHWDCATYMPPAAAQRRGEQVAEIKVRAHEILTGSSLPHLLEEAGEDDDLDDWQKANLREMGRKIAHVSALPVDLVAALSRASASCEAAWRVARRDGRFRDVLPEFDPLLSLTREAAQAKAHAFGCAPYDALIDQWEPGGRSAFIDPLFDQLETFLENFIPRVIEFQSSRPPPVPLPGPFSVSSQHRLAQTLMGAVGFDSTRGRLDTSAHPFCAGSGDDIRVTIRYDEADFAQAIMAVLHETGHALYELGLPRRWHRQPVGEARGMSLHESQSLSVEMQACRSREFLHFLAPLARKHFNGHGPAWAPDNLYRLTTRVQPSLIRVDADEVTYPAHVILRYGLEKSLLSGALPASELPMAWREGMTRLVGCTPKGDGEGCLQDIHWYEGIWGYFPTYVLGAMTAAQLFTAARRAHPDLMTALGQGDFTPLIAWMGSNVHGWGSFYATGNDVLEKATGKPLDETAYRAHLCARYLEQEP